MKKNKKNEPYNAELTKDDLKALGGKTKNIRTDEGDDKWLRERKKDVDFTGEDLDIPGRDLPQDTTKKTLKDEENQLYSQGGSGNEDLKRNTE